MDLQIPTYLSKQKNKRIAGEQILRDPCLLMCTLSPLFSFLFSDVLFICMCTHSQFFPSCFIPRQASRKEQSKPRGSICLPHLQCSCFLPASFLFLEAHGWHRPLHAKASGHARSLVKCEHAQRLPECVTSLFPSQPAASLVSLKPVSLKLVFRLSYALLSLRTALRCRIHSCP